MSEGMTTLETIKLLVPVIGIQILLMVFCLYRLVKDRVRFLPKWAWAIIIVFFNIIGPIIFLTFGRERD